MQYKAIYLERNDVFIEGDDYYLTFCIQNSEGTILTDLTGWTFKAELFNDANTVELENSDFSVSGAKITLLIPHADTESLADEYGETYYYDFELQGTYDSKIYTLLQMKIDIKSQEIED